MLLLRQSTAYTFRIGPFLDETDGFTAEGSLTITQPDIRLSKDGGDFAQLNAAGTLTYDEAGWYILTLDTDDTDTLGSLIIAIHESGALPVWVEYLVVPADVYDTLVAGTDALPVQVEGMDAEVIDDAALANALDVYQAKVWLLDAEGATTDRYACAFFKNGGLIAAGVTVPDLWVFTMAASPANLVGTSGSPQALTEAGATETWFHNEASGRVVDGTQYMARVRFTVDGSQRTWMQPVGRDSA